MADENRIIGRVMDIEYDDSDELVVNMVMRTQSGKRKICNVYGTIPYLFVHQDAQDPRRNEYLAEYVGGVDAGYESFDGHDLLRVDCTIPKHVRKVREKYDTTWEADLPFVRRCTADYNMSGYVSVPDEESFHVSEIEDIDRESVDNISPRACMYDIEVEVPDTFYDDFAEEAKNEVQAITAYDSYENEYTLFCLDPDLSVDPSKIRGYIEENWEGHDDYDEMVDLDIVFKRFGQESTLLQAFAEYVGNRQFDVMTGWNAVDFDHEYIVNRMHKFAEVNIHQMSDVGTVGGRRTDTYIEGTPAIDMMQAFCGKLTYGKWQSQSLDYVSNEVLGAGKVEGDDVNYDANRTKFMAYNIVDVQLCKELDDARGILQFWYLLAEVTAIPPYEVGTTMKECEGYLFKHRDSDEILPTTEEEDMDTIEGGLVLPAHEGLEDWVGVHDLKSLYPSSIITCNISKETMTRDPSEADVIVPDVPLNYEKVAGDKIESKDIEWEIGKGACIGFTLDDQGILPKYLTKLFDERAQLKAIRDTFDPDSPEYERYNQQQRAVKVVMNSFFGVSDHPYFRLSADGLGAAITSVSRFVSWGGVQAIENEGYDVLYGDSVTGDTVVRTNFGDTEIRNLFPDIDDSRKVKVDTENLQVLSVDNSGKQKMRDVDQVIRHKTDKKIYEIETNSGKTVRVTEDHSLLKKSEDNKIVETKPRHIQTGCLVPVYGSMQRVSGRRQRSRLRGVRGSKSASSSTQHDSRGVSREVRTGCSVSGRGCSREKSKEYRLGECSGVEERELAKRRLPSESDRVIERSNSLERRNVRRGDEGENRRRKLRGMAEEEGSVNKSMAQEQSRRESETGGKLCRVSSESRGDRNREESQRVSGKSGSQLRTRTLPSDQRQPLGCRFSDREYFVCDDRRLLLAQLSSLQLRSRFTKTETKQKSRQTIQSGNVGRVERVSQNLGSRSKRRPTRTCDFEEVTDIRVVDTEEVYVYDLSVEDTETFYADGIFVHNTDSLMTQISSDPDADPESVVDDMLELEETINSSLTPIADQIGLPDKHPFFPDDFHGNGRHAWVYESEKLFRRWMQAGTKKRYAGKSVWKEGKYTESVSVSGFALEKSDATELTKHVQEELLDMALSGAGFKEMSDFVREQIRKVENGDFNVQHIGFPSSINKPLEEYPNMPVKRAAMYSNKHLGYEWKADRDPWLIYVDETRPGLPNTDVIALEWTDDSVPDGFTIDAQKHVDKGIKKPVKTMSDAFDFTWEELKTGKREQSFLGAAANDTSDEPMFDDSTETEDPFSHLEE